MATDKTTTAPASILSRLGPAKPLGEALIKSGMAFGAARHALSAAIFALSESKAHEALGMDFGKMACAIATEAGFDLSRSTVYNALRIGTVRKADPVNTAAMADTVVLRMAEMLGESASDPATVAALAAEVAAEGGTVEGLRKVRANRGGTAKADPETEAIRIAAEALGKVWKCANGRRNALAAVAKALDLNGLSAMIAGASTSVTEVAAKVEAAKAEAAPQRRKARPSAEAIAKATANMAKADAKAEAKAKAKA